MQDRLVIFEDIADALPEHDASGCTEIRPYCCEGCHFFAEVNVTVLWPLGTESL
jgi:hypothetical protein